MNVLNSHEFYLLMPPSSLALGPTIQAPHLPRSHSARRIGQPTAHGKRRGQQRRRLGALIPGRTDTNIACVSNGGGRLIYIQTVDRPESICECSGVMLHVVIAGIREGGAVGAILPDLSSPVAAKVCIEDLRVFGLVSKLIVAYEGRKRWNKSAQSRCGRKIIRTICILLKWLEILQFP